MSPVSEAPLLSIILFNLVIALVLWFLAAYTAFTKRHLRARLMCVVLVGAGLWALGYAMEMLSGDLASKLLWARLQFVGVGLMHSSVIFLIHYFKEGGRIGLRDFLLPCLVPAAMVALVLSGSHQPLVYAGVEMDALNQYAPLRFTPGPAYTFFLAYSYLVVLGANAYVAVKATRRGTRNDPLLVGWVGLTLLPAAISCYTNFVSKPGVDYSPLAFGLVLLIFTLFTPGRFRLGGILPIAYASIVSGMEDMVLLVDRSNRIIHANPSAEEKLSRFLGVARDGLVGQDVGGVIEGGSFASLGSASGLEARIMGRSYDVSAFYASNWGGEPSNLVIVMRDITERVKAERQLQLLHNYAVKVASAGSLERVGEVARTALRDGLRFLAGGLVLCKGNRFEPLVSWGLDEGALMDVARANMAKSCKARGSRAVAAGCEGSPSWFGWLIFLPVSTGEECHLVVMAFRDASGDLASSELTLLETFAEHVASVINRIDHELALEEMQRAEIRRILEGANRVSSMVRHDLRGPLQTIRNASYLIRRSPDNIAQMAPVIDKSVDYMVKVLEELRYTDSSENLNLVNLDVNTLVRQSLKQVIIPEKIRVETVYGEPEVVCPVDKVRLQRALDNLIRNAIEAMPDGGKLTITTSSRDEGVRLTVSDTGVGIADVGDLFKPFVTTKKNGMGLGLVSCKYAVEAHGGALGVESKPGEGTTFTVDLPGPTSDRYESHECEGHDGEVEQEAHPPGHAQR